MFGDSEAAAPLGGELELFGYQVVSRKRGKRLLKKFDVLTKRVKKEVGADGAGRHLRRLDFGIEQHHNFLTQPG